MNHWLFGIKYIINNWLLKKSTPLICGIVMHNKCNLKCRHCRVTSRETAAVSFDEAIRVINLFYQNGGRTLYLEGGEPFTWHDGQYHIEDIIEFSHKIGFQTIIIYTNGTIPLNSSADTIFISIDGLQETHDYLRGNTFYRIMKNIHDSNHKSLYVNYTINNQNKNEIKEFCEYIEKIDKIKGVFFYFHTPYYGYDDLYIEPDERNKILSALLMYEKKYKILNSQAGIKAALRNEWQRPLEICQVYENGTMFKCCRYPDDPELCQNCGYLSYPEIIQTMKLKPSAILKASKYF